MARNEDFYEKAVLSSLERGPKIRHELVKELTPSDGSSNGKMSVKKLQNTLNSLEDEEVIIHKHVRIQGTHSSASLYALPQDESLIKASSKMASAVSYQKTGRKPTTLEGMIRRTIEELRFVLMRDPKILEVGHKIGKPPELIRSTLFKLSPELGWKAPTEKQCSDAQEKSKKIYEFATLYHCFDRRVFDSHLFAILDIKSRDEAIRRVTYASKKEADELPKIVKINEDTERIEFKFRWPKGSNWYRTSDYSQYYYKKTGEVSQKLRPEIERVKSNLDKLIKDIKDSNEM